MKKIIPFLTILLLGFVLHAQDKIYVHTATAANTNNHITYIDHPDLNGNPDAGIVFSHVWNPHGDNTGGVYNDNIDGLWYDSSAGKWAIYNEDRSPMIPGASFFVYIASDPNDVITHIATAANQSPAGAFSTALDPAVFGVDPGPYAVMSNYWNPNGVYNPHNYGFFYDDTYGTNTRNIYRYDLGDIPTGAAFKILVYGSVPAFNHFTHEATASNITANATRIDYPDLNNNPNASFVFSHYWGVNGPSTQTNIDKKVGAYYNSLNGYWYLYTEDYSGFPVGAAFDIIIADRDVLGVEEITNAINFSIFPNPATDVIKITADQPVISIEVYSLLGQKVATFDSKDKLTEINIKNLKSGVYLLKAKDIKGGLSTTKLIKK